MTASEPRVAVWLVDLCASPAEADAICGDLHEEFAAIVGREGVRAARRWYWRQALRTAPSLVAGALRARPAVMAAAGLITLAATMPVYSITDRAAKTLVVRFPVYHYISAPSFWLVATIIPFFLAGFALARVMRQPIAAAVAVVLTIAIVNAVDVPLVAWWYGGLPMRMRSPLQFVVRWLNGVAVFGAPVLAGAITGASFWRPSTTNHQQPVTTSNQ
jgi:hypothetical protein